MQKQLFFSFYLNNIQTRFFPQELQGLTEGAYFEYTYISLYKTVKKAYKSQRINMLTGSTNVHLFRYMKSVRI